MKFNRNHLFITISSIALIAILIIQINWLLQTAQIKAELFNEKANMVLSRTIESLNTNVVACKNIADSAVGDSSSALVTNLRKEEIQIIDSLFNYYLRFYNFHVDYKFEVTKRPSNSEQYGSGFTNNSYIKTLNENFKNNGVELKLILPEKKQFIIAELGIMFITSILLILVVLFLFWQTILSLIREKQVSEQTNEFLNNMTHEFKTPLTNISLAGKMIIKDQTIGDEDKVKNYTSIILDENEKLIHQVDQVLSMTALERNEIPLNKKQLNIHELIEQVSKNIKIQIEFNDGRLTLNLYAEKVLVNGDPFHLKNAISNLIDNAIKYSINKPDITIQTSNYDQMILIEVVDKGIGIEKEFHKAIFVKYFRIPTGDVHSVKGFGLGLPYVMKIVELHKGILLVNSEKGKGSSFIIKLPYE